MIDIYNAIITERNRQDRKHPQAPMMLTIPTDPSENQSVLRERLTFLQNVNDIRARIGAESWYGVMLEELLEVVTARSKKEQITEAIQLAALCVRFVEATKKSASKN